MVRKIFLFFTMLLLYELGWAQDIMVESFCQLDTDLTANTNGTIVLDQNDEKCALIKVSTPQTYFAFDAGMMGIVKTVQQLGEIWVYVPAGVKRLTISHAGMETLRDYDLGMSVQRACTYLLTLKTTKDVVLQTVTFKVSPSNSIVMIESADNESDFGKRPLPLSSNGEGSIKIPVGEYKYTAIANGYNVEEGTFTLTASAPRKVIMELVSMDGTTAAQPVPEAPNNVSPEITTSNLNFAVEGVSFNMIYVAGGSLEEKNTTKWKCSSCGEKNNYGDYCKSCGAKNGQNNAVAISSYHICETEVTQELWEAVMGSNPASTKNDKHNPVDNVSWDDCQQFISRLNSLTGRHFRLPTKDEWEYAAIGGAKTHGYTFSGSNDPSSVAWYDANSGKIIHPVKGKAPNELGIYDMSGNVWEWCSDSYDKAKSHVVRGGSSANYILCCMNSYQNSEETSSRNNFLGFRIAL